MFRNKCASIQEELNKNKISLDYDPSHFTPNEFNFELTTPSEIFDIIHKLPPNKSPGVDGLTSECVKEVAEIISAPVSDCINASLLQGVFPEKMKIGRIIPLHKKDSRLDINNYRYLTILSVISKVYERAVHTKLYNYLTERNLLSNCQFGFRKNRSTQDAALAFLNEIHDALENGEIPAGILYDMTKAFDAMNHKLVCHRLKQLGCGEPVVNWFTSYLRNRNSTVVLTDESGNKFVSLPMISNVGVPQGSIIGPLCFLITINGLPGACNNGRFFLYADDSNVALSGKNADEVYNKITECNDKVDTWTRNNGLALNANKTTTMIFRKCSELNKLLEESGVNVSESAKFLGIIIDRNLKFEEHVKLVSDKLKKGIYALRSLRDFLPRNELLSVYHALIGSQLTYGILVWGLTTNHNMEKLLRLQKWAIRTICKLPRRTSCRDKFKELGIMTFPSLYGYHASIFIHEKVSKGELMLNRDVHNHDTRTKSQIFIDHKSSKKTMNTIYSNGIRVYNELPNEIRNLGMTMFRKRSREHFLNLTSYKYNDILSCN
jgi:hypothetical protein